jgi:pimeloyl-ACP methyl ester carboxylesterase
MISGPSVSPQSRYLGCEGLSVHLMDWGPSDAPVVVAWHGLARTGRDMDLLAAHLSSGPQPYRVLCPDTPGRGLSQWSPQPQADYCLGAYARVATSLLDQLGVQQLHWVGTSMGGALGTVLAAGALQGRMQSLVLNDNGPQLAAAAIARIRQYAGQPPAFASLPELEDFFRAAYAPFGELTDAQWRHLAETSARRLPDGRLTPHYDPAIVGQFEHHPTDYDLWPTYDRVTCPVLCLRGEHSDLLLPEVTHAMQQRGPQAQVVTVPNCGHAPALNNPWQIELVERFVRSACVAVA